jgi:hypothetical protein
MTSERSFRGAGATTRVAPTERFVGATLVVVLVGVRNYLKIYREAQPSKPLKAFYSGAPIPS